VTAKQAELLDKAEGSLDAARVLVAVGHHGYAAARAYCAMYYVSEALLLSEGLAFSKHSAVVSAVGAHFAKTGRIPKVFHRELIEAMDVRHEADYDTRDAVTEEQAMERIARAEEFLRFVRDMLTGTAVPDAAEEASPA
jgi:uncharacterized protein (UPF0332 family)